ncbi:hypothetical protein BIS11_10120, partial [Halomonas sp. 707D4]|nr:hypothetical protein [Halomonas sp. 707D4]
FQYYDNDEVQRVSVPAGEFDTHSVILQDVDKPDRHLQIDFHPDWPGLILSAEYYKDGRRDTTLRLTQFDPSESASP